MPSSYSASARYTLQATGENNNTWGVILNNGVFQLVDDNINGRLGFALSGTKVLTTALGAPDEARMAFLDVAGGTGGAVVIPPVPKGYFIRNAAAGVVSITQSGAINGVFDPGDYGPVFADGAGNVYQLTLGNKTLRAFITDADQLIINYVNAAISAGSISLPPALGQTGKALIVRNLPPESWVPDFIRIADVAGLVPRFDLGRAFYGDLF